MTYEGDSINVPHRHKVIHYHGDEVRALFVISALVLIVAKSTGADLPLTTTEAIASAALLVVAAGVTNPNQHSIHWFNALLAAIGTILFGTSAVDHYRAGLSFLDSSFISTEALALLSLLALYFTTRTIRGLFQRSRLA